MPARANPSGREGGGDGGKMNENLMQKYVREETRECVPQECFGARAGTG